MTGSAFAMMNFSSISEIIALTYKVDKLLVNICVICFLISFIFFNFLSIFLMEKYGLKITVSINQK
jgi:hypothetical protein